MNTYIQQNNLSARFTSITIVNIEFLGIVKNSSINDYLTKLEFAFREFERYKKYGDIKQIKSKAIQINSLIETLIDPAHQADSKSNFVEKLIRLLAIIIKSYEDIAHIEGFNNELHNELISYCHSFFNTHFKGILSSDFWWNLRFYEWCEKEDFVQKNHALTNSRHFNLREHYFSDEQLDSFFSKNKRKIIETISKRIANCTKCGESYECGKCNKIIPIEKCGIRCAIYDPLENQDADFCLDLYKLLPILKIINIKQTDNYCLEILFSDNTRKIVDFGSFLKRSNHPDIRKYLNKELFSRFTIENGDLMWGGYDLCFPIADLYDGTI